MVVTRFSPSPTGHSGLHLGSLRTALTSFIAAKQQGGRFILRIEDTDAVRSLKETEEKILKGMEWLGLVPDVQMPRQSERSGTYTEVTKALVKHGFAYYCQCTTEDLKAMKAHQIRTKGRIGYNSKCRDSLHTHGVLRLNVRKIAQTFGFKRLDIVDDIIGVHHVDYRDIPDTVLLRADGTATYILANTVDDCLAGVSYITRGSDLYPQTATQVLMYMAIQFVMELPRNDALYAHLPLITDAKKLKLSKRDPQTKGILDYKALGYLPDAISQFALSLGNKSIPIDKALSLEDMITMFDIKKSRASNTSFLEHTLDYVNRLHIRAKSADELAVLLKEFGVTADSKLISLFQGRVNTVKELADNILAVLRAVTDHPQEVKKLQRENFSAVVCKEFRDKVLHHLPTPPLDTILEVLAS